MTFYDEWIYIQKFSSAPKGRPTTYLVYVIGRFSVCILKKKKNSKKLHEKC